MADRINRIGRFSSVSRTAPVRRYTPAERAAKVREIEQAAAEREEIAAYLAKFPNPNHLTFAELLEGKDEEQTVEPEPKNDELDFVVELKGQRGRDVSGVVVEIKTQK